MRVLPLLFALVAAAGATDAEQARALRLAERFRCPTCRFVSVADSNVPISNEIRALILDLVMEGQSNEEIEAYLVSRYGDWVVFSPPTRGVHMAVWVLPPLAMLGALAFFVLRVRRLATAPGDEEDGSDGG
ncbi:cytochrome c-type biogenesis protein CcmH [bacterium]|nr:cytochrome c-type biogenesis protein CcmH [bacterium]